MYASYTRCSISSAGGTDETRAASERIGVYIINIYYYYFTLNNSNNNIILCKPDHVCCCSTRLLSITHAYTQTYLIIYANYNIIINRMGCARVYMYIHTVVAVVSGL